jgi:Tfp pilus assembly protein PilO
MKQNSKRFSSMILALLLVVAALIVYFDLLEPAYGSLQMAKGQELSEQQLLSNEKQVVAQVQGLVTSYQSQSGGDQSVNMALPINEDVAGALAQIYGLASANQVSLQSVGISAQEVAVPAVAPVSDQIEGAAEGGGSIVKPVGSISLTMTAQGSYESLKSFLQSLQTNLRLFDVTNITLTKGTSNQDFFNYSVTAETYYQGS